MHEQIEYKIEYTRCRRDTCLCVCVQSHDRSFATSSLSSSRKVWDGLGINLSVMLAVSSLFMKVLSTCQPKQQMYDKHLGTSGDLS